MLDTQKVRAQHGSESVMDEPEPNVCSVLQRGIKVQVRSEANPAVETLASPVGLAREVC